MVALHYTARAQNGRTLELPAEAEAQLHLQSGDEVQISILGTPHTTLDENAQEAARLAAIDAAMGSMAQWQVTSDDLRRERQADDALAERQLRGVGV